VTDETDDWMNPPKRQTSYVHTPRYPRFLIERKRRLDYFPFEQWGHWNSYDCRAERDAAFKELRDKHPAWQLRTRDELMPPVAYLSAGAA
jgi:hypothetical protein